MIIQKIYDEFSININVSLNKMVFQLILTIVKSSLLIKDPDDNDLRNTQETITELLMC